jgi:hypothetical protein
MRLGWSGCCCCIRNSSKASTDGGGEGRVVLVVFEGAWRGAGQRDSGAGGERSAGMAQHRQYKYQCVKQVERGGLELKQISGTDPPAFTTLT